MVPSLSFEQEVDVRLKSNQSQSMQPNPSPPHTAPNTPPRSEDIPSPSSPVRALAATTASLTRDPNDVPTHTPGRPRNSSRAQLPASPAQVAEYVEDHSQRFTASLNDLLTLSTLPDILEDLRINLSTVPAILLSCLALEAYGLFDAILPWKATGLAIPVPVFGPRGSPYIWNPKLPDLFMLLSPEFFWKPFLLWSGTSIFVPLFFAYFYNLTMRDIKRAGVRVTVPRSRVDPMTFSVVKMLVTMLVYGNGIFFGGAVDEIAAERVHGAVFGGYQGICVGAAVGAVASLYEAVQRK